MSTRRANRRRIDYGDVPGGRKAGCKMHYDSVRRHPVADHRSRPLAQPTRTSSPMGCASGRGLGTPQPHACPPLVRDTATGNLMAVPWRVGRKRRRQTRLVAAPLPVGPSSSLPSPYGRVGLVWPTGPVMTGPPTGMLIVGPTPPSDVVIIPRAVSRCQVTARGLRPGD